MDPHQPGLLANYNSLTDKHLTGYFSNTRIRRHLLRSGLISRSGRIIPEREYRLNAMRKDHKKYIRECLAQAIFQKVLEMERHHQGEIKRKLEKSAKKEHIHRIKVDHSKKKIEETDHQFFPHPPTGPRDHFRRHRLGDRGQSVHSASTPRPSTAPGNIQHPVRLQPLCGYTTTESTSKATLSSTTKFHTRGKKRPRVFSSTGDKGTSRAMFSTDYSSGISPYRFPMINNYIIPIPPPSKSEKNLNTMKAATSRARRLRPATAPNGLEQLLVKDTGRFYKPQVHTNACVTMIYLGRTVHLSYDLFDYREEVKVYQQHCGGENLCVYRGKLLEGETFQFISRRHHGFPFSLTFYLNGIQVDRLSSCCEYKHQKGTRLGGKHGYFGFVNVERSAPCYRCIIAMGLDKKPSPPKKKVADEDEAKKEEFTSLEKEEVKEGLNEHSSRKGKSKDSQSESLRAEEEKEHVEGIEEMEWESNKGKIQDTSERNKKYQRHAVYDKDFEADEGKSDEKVNEEGQADDQMNGMSKSPSDDEKDNLDHERENKISSPKALQATDSERDESDGYMESESEEGKQDKKQAPSPSSSSMLCSSENVSDSETRKQGDEQDNMDIHSEYESETTKSQRVERQEIDMEEEEDGGKTEDSTAKDSPDALFGRRMGTDVEDTGSLSEKLSFVGPLDMDMREGPEEDMLMCYRGSIQEETARSQMPSTDEEEGESISVKEKIAEDIEYDQPLSSEPEPSDSSAEYEEEDAVANGYNQEVADGASLAKSSGEFISETIAEQERQMVGKEEALEEEEILDQEGPEDTIPKEEFLVMENDGKDQLLREENELEKEAEIMSDTDDVKGDEMYEKIKSSEGELEAEGEMKEPDEMLSDHGISDGEEISEGYLLEGEEIEDQSITEDLTSVGEDEKEKIEAYEMLGTEELTGKEAAEKEILETEETLKEADEAPETAFSEEIQENMEEAEFEGYEILPEKEPVAEGVVEVKLTDGEDVGVTSLKDEGGLEESEDVEIKLEKAFFTEIECRVPESKMEEIISMNEEGVASEKLVDEDGFIQEIPCDMEDSVQEESCIGEGDLEKISPERSKVEIESTEEYPLDHDDTERVILRTEEETMKGKGATINGQEEDLASVLQSEEKSKIEEPTIEIMARTKETVLQDVNIVGVFEEKSEQRGREEILEPEVTFQKKEFFTDVVPEALPFATEESIKKTEEKTKVVIKGESETEETERNVMAKGKVKAERTKRKEVVEAHEEEEATQRLLTVKWKVKDEDSESEGEVMSLVTESEGEPTSEMTIVRCQNIVNRKEDFAAEAEEGPESSAWNVTSTGELNKEKRMENEPDVQDELEETPEKTEHTSVYMKIQNEEVTDDEEKEDEGSDKEEQVTGGQITLADVEEALLIGIQQFITEVSRINEEVEGKEEEPPAEDLAEERANQKDPERDELFSAVLTKERWQAESEKVEERGIGEPMDRTPVKGNIGDRKEITRQEESPEKNQTVTEIIQWSTERSDGGQH